ncbi:GlxA family transcriptional regulator [Nioella nitratireducens]|uniref:GlxA family transcriptional regulator n=1 Tax=Nioella nitratireducens TaxID=1287720 RepID=UPI001F19AEF2|nr:GlxA family transcriptional regulator [Nioella nitratireducens]
MSPPRSVGVLLFPAFSNHCLANAVEPLRGANTLSRRTLYDWQFLSLDGAGVASSSGLTVQPEARLSNHPGGDYLLVMPSYDFERHATPATKRALRAAAGRFKTVVGLDTGSWLMAAAGLLDGRPATIHWDEMENLAESFPEVEVIEDRFVIDGTRITCGGTTTTFELMLDLIGQHHGALLRLEVAALFMHGEADPRADPMLRLPGDRLVQAAVSIMRRNIEVPLPIGEVAARLRLSQRGLEAHFAAETGMTPRAVYTALRLRAVQLLVERTSLGMVEIATRCGYTDASAMTRAFRREFGQPPTALRRHRPTGVSSLK